jgi:hypothetical protein
LIKGDTHTPRQHGDRISLLLLFQNKENRLKIIYLYAMWIGKPEGKKLVGGIRRGWVDNIKMDFREIGWSGMERIHLAQNREQWRALVNPAAEFRDPEFLAKLSGWRLLQKVGLSVGRPVCRSDGLTVGWSAG